MPTLFEKIAESEGVKFDVHSATESGASLKDHWHGEKKSQAVDLINNKMGAGTLFYGSQGICKSKKNSKKIIKKWNMKSHFKSRCYTTNWNELLIVK